MLVTTSAHERCPILCLVTLDNLITTVFCVTNDLLNSCLDGVRLRQRGLRPTVPGSVVVTCELAGKFLGYGTDSGIYRYIGLHHLDLFQAKKVWARDPWHICARWVRKITSHAMAILLCR